MPRKLPQPDTRLDWRDPEMPVIGKSGNPIDHHKMQIKSQMAMGFSSKHYPEYRDDPTYNLRRKPK